MVAAEPGASDRACTIASPPHDPHSSPSARPAPSSPQRHPSHLFRPGERPGQHDLRDPVCAAASSWATVPRALHRAHPQHPSGGAHRSAPHRTTAPHAPRRAAPHRTRRTAPPHRLGAQNVHRNCSVDPEAGTMKCNCDRFIAMGGEQIGGDSGPCRDFSYEKLEPIRFTVQVTGCSIHAHAHAHAHACAHAHARAHARAHAHAVCMWYKGCSREDDPFHRAIETGG